MVYARLKGSYARLTRLYALLGQGYARLQVVYAWVSECNAQLSRFMRAWDTLGLPGHCTAVYQLEENKWVENN